MHSFTPYKKRTGASSASIRVLMHNRSNVFSQRGGDTVLMERLKVALEARNVEVVFDLDGSANLAEFDIVHIFNFALPEMVRFFGERAEQARKPFVVTTLAEDIPCFHNQSIAYASTLMDYVARGQDSGWSQANLPQQRTVANSPRFDNAWAADHAAALLSNGGGETRVLRREYGQAVRITEIKLGSTIGAPGDKQLFINQFGLSDFVLSVGRIESRKNQLMLLKALEHSELPVVFAGGGFTYQPGYTDAVRAFKRKGKTLLLDKLSPEMLASAYCAARVHVLPSWYELPGLVSLEAASYGCPIVVSDTGTTRDYVGETAWYVDPGNELSIKNAVYAAYYAPEKSGLKEVAMKYSWEQTAEQTLKEYQQILGVSEVVSTQASSVKTIDLGQATEPSRREEADKLLDEGEAAARAREYNRAHQLFEQADKIDPLSVRSHRVRGAVYLAENLVGQARRYFESALRINASDAKSLSGLGMCDLNEGKTESAYNYILRALEIEPFQLVAILQLVQCSYILERFDRLEGVLRRYLHDFSQDNEMRYCLAGCLYKQNRMGEALSEIKIVLEKNPEHQGAIQLRDIIAGKATQVIATPKIEAEASRALFSEKIGQLEEDKHQRRYESIIEKSTIYLAESGMSRDERSAIECLKAEAYIFSSQVDLAEEIYKRVLNEDPDYPRALCGQGALASSRGQSAEARVVFERALKRDSKSDVALAGLGMVEQAGGNFHQAWNLFKQANQLNPENGRALYGIIELGYHFSNFDDIEQALNAYLECHPGDVNYLYALAGCYFRQERMADAQQEIDKILLLDPQNANAHEMVKLIAERRYGAPAFESQVQQIGS